MTRLVRHRQAFLLPRQGPGDMCSQAQRTVPYQDRIPLCILSSRSVCPLHNVVFTKTRRPLLLIATFLLLSGDTADMDMSAEDFMKVFSNMMGEMLGGMSIKARRANTSFSITPVFGLWGSAGRALLSSGCVMPVSTRENHCAAHPLRSPWIDQS